MFVLNYKDKNRLTTASLFLSFFVWSFGQRKRDVVTYISFSLFK